MIDDKTFVLLSLCLDISAGDDERKPLTNAEFHKLMHALDVYNGTGGDGVQYSLFPSENSIEFEFLPEVEESFFVNDLNLGEALGAKIETLLRHSSAISFEIERLGSFTKFVTVFDDDYPKKLRDELSKMPDSMREPPLLYYCGDLNLCDLKYAGFVGARDIDESDVAWTREAVTRISEKGAIDGIVSGGAEGVDYVAETTAKKSLMPVIEFSKNMKNTLRDASSIDAVQENKMLLLSEVNPLCSLSKHEATAHFMNRNKYIYAMSEYAVVVKAAKKAGSGTWTGAKEALDRGLCSVYVRDVPYEGNKDLIEAGGKRIA